MVPYLCGGIFFLILGAIKAKSVSLKDMALALLRMADSKFDKGVGKTFNTDLSAYRYCKKNSSGYLPFNDPLFVRKYDNKIRDSFDDALSEMEAFTKKFFNETNWLNCAMLSLLRDDEGIRDNEILFYCDGGMEKHDILNLETVSTPELLLALWHFIIMERPNNLNGRATFEAWTEKPDEKGAQWKLKSEVWDAFLCKKELTLKRPCDILSKKILFEGQEEKNMSVKQQKVADVFDSFIADGKTFIYNGEVTMNNSGPGPQIENNSAPINITIHMPGTNTPTA